MPALFGDDFAFKNANYSFTFIDEFAKLLNKHSKERYGIQMDIIYSTVDDYLNAIHKSDYSYPVYNGDFLPYT